MAEQSAAFLDSETLDRIEAVFDKLDYEQADHDSWVGDEDDATDQAGKLPLIVWEREVSTRDIVTGSSLDATDLLALLKDSGGRLIMERWVILDQEDCDGEEELSFAVNMYNGELLQDQPDPNTISMTELFKDKFSLIEEDHV